MFNRAFAGSVSKSKGPTNPLDMDPKTSHRENSYFGVCQDLYITSLTRITSTKAHTRMRSPLSSSRPPIFKGHPRCRHGSKLENDETKNLQIDIRPNLESSWAQVKRTLEKHFL